MSETNRSGSLIHAEKGARALQKMPFIACLSLVICVNFLFMAGHDRQRIAEVLALTGAGVFALIFRSHTYARMFKGAAGQALAAFFILGAVSSTLAFMPRYAFFEVAAFFMLYLFSTLAGDDIARNGRAGITLPIQLVALGCTLHAAHFVFAYYTDLSLHLPITVDDFTRGFSNIRFFNHTQTSLLPLLLLLCCLTSRESKGRWLWLAVTTYWWMALYATSARGTLIGIAAGCVVVALVARQRAMPYLRVIGLTAISAVVAYYILLVAIPPIFDLEGMSAFSDTLNRTAADPTSARTYLWERALPLIVQHPWLGVGPMHFAHHAGDMHIGAHPHDWLVQIGLEWGLPALLCLFVAIGLGLRALVRAGLRVPAGDTDNQAMFAALLLGAVAILVDGLVSGIFVMPQSQLGVALYLGCALGWQRHLTPAAPQKVPHRAVRLLMKASVVAAMVAIVAAVWVDVPAKWRGDDPTPAQRAANTGNVLSPRLWIAGFF